MKQHGQYLLHGAGRGIAANLSTKSGLYVLMGILNHLLTVMKFIAKSLKSDNYIANIVL